MNATNHFMRPSTPRSWVMRATLLMVGLGASMLSGSCRCDPDPPDPPVPPKSEPARIAGRETVESHDACLAPEQRIPPQELCPEERRILARGPGQCSDFVGWAHTEIGQHCVYAYVGTEADGRRSVAEFQQLRHASLPVQPLDHVPKDPVHLPPALASASRDCMVMASGDPDPERQTLAKRFGQSLRLTPSSSAGPVRVAVIDTAPKQTANGQALHGRLMAAIVREATRDLGAITIETHLGMPRDRHGIRDDQKGGFYGYQSDVAVAIEAAVDAWEPTEARLILNLSFGWEPNMGADESLVTAAIAKARCKGALVFAAVGNRHPRACPIGPTAPAAFSTWTFECHESGAVAKPSSGTAQPLVHAVSPVDATGRPLPLSRASAPIAALGTNAMIHDGTNYLGPMSGSSVATALASGMAARIWSNKPNLTADDVATLLRDSGVVATDENGIPSITPVDPTVAYGSNWTEQRIVGLVVSAPTSSPTRLSAKTVVKPIETPLETLDCSVCDETKETVWWPTGGKSFAPKPNDWAVPQPDDVLCPNCDIEYDKLLLTRASSYGDPVVDVSVTFWANRNETETIHFGPQTVPTAEPPLVLAHPELCSVGRAGSSGPTPTSAYVDFVFSKTSPTGTTSYYTLGHSIDVTSGTPCPK